MVTTKGFKITTTTTEELKDYKKDTQRESKQLQGDTTLLQIAAKRDQTTIKTKQKGFGGFNMSVPMDQFIIHPWD